MNPLALLPFLNTLSLIAQTLSANSSNAAKVNEYVGYLNLATSLVSRLINSNTDLTDLDNQMKEAVAANRGLTDAQRAAWRARSDIATEVASKWLADHPAA